MVQWTSTSNKMNLQEKIKLAVCTQWRFFCHLQNVSTKSQGIKWNLPNPTSAESNVAKNKNKGEP